VKITIEMNDNVITEVTPVASIKLESVIAMRDTLRSYSVNWCEMLARKMYSIPENVSFRKMTQFKNKINSIVSGGATNNASRVLFLIKAEELIQEFREQQARASELERKLEAGEPI